MYLHLAVFLAPCIVHVLQIQLQTANNDPLLENSYFLSVRPLMLRFKRGNRETENYSTFILQLTIPNIISQISGQKNISASFHRQCSQKSLLKRVCSLFKKCQKTTKQSIHTWNSELFPIYYKHNRCSLEPRSWSFHLPQKVMICRVLLKILLTSWTNIRKEQLYYIYYILSCTSVFKVYLKIN